MRRVKLILLALLSVILALMFWVSAPRVRASDYGTYDNLLLDTFAGHIIALWPLNETSGTTAYDISGNGHNGTYSGVTLDQIDGAGSSFGRAGSWDGINDFCDIYSSDLASAFHFASGTIGIWFKIYDLGTWTDGTLRELFFLGNAGTSEYVGLRDPTTAAQLAAMRNDDGGLSGFSFDSGSSLSWFYLALTFDATSNKSIFYVNATPISPTGTAANDGFVLSDTYAVIGALSINGYRSTHGYLQQAIILDYAASNDEIAILSNANPSPPTPTPTETPVPSATFTPRPPQLIATLQNGNQWELDYTITAGQVATFIPGLILIGLLIFVILIRLVRR